jgi:hypothetical protein
MIPGLRAGFNRSFAPERYVSLLDALERSNGVRTEFRVAETPIFVPLALLDSMAAAGVDLARRLLGDTTYLDAARQAIPQGYIVAAENTHPNFLTADFALVKTTGGHLEPRLVEIQAFPSVYGFQAVLCDAYRESFDLQPGLGCFLSGLDEASYWKLLARTIMGNCAPEEVVLTEIDPLHQKTRPDFEITARRLGIVVRDITTLTAEGNRLYYATAEGRRVAIKRIYNRAIADELIARNVRLAFNFTREWEVEWAGHPNWYFLISKFSIPWLSRPANAHPVVPPAVFLDEFLDGPGRAQLQAQGVPVAPNSGPETIYGELLLKPLFSFAGKGIRFDPTQGELEAIPRAERRDFLLQQRMQFAHTIETPFGLTQPEFRILYLWPDRGDLTPALSLVRLGRGRMMGVDFNRNQEWVGASAAFYPLE